MRECALPDTDDLARAVAKRAAEVIHEAQASRGNAFVAFSGGNTPRTFHSLMVDVDWSRVTGVLSDERWVPTDHPDSNEAMVHETLPGLALTGLYGGEATPAEGLAACEARLASLPWPLDLALLGMGPDGHFASLFPGTGPWDGRGRCFPVAETTERAARMSLRPAPLCEARHVLLFLSGEGKNAALDRAKAGEDLPVRVLIEGAGERLEVFRA